MKKKKKKICFFSGEKEIKKLLMEFNPIGSFLCLFIERMTFGLEWQIVFGIARSKFRHSRRSWRRNGRTGSHWSTCANTLYFPCADTVEPAVLPLTCIDIERNRQLFTHLDVELFYFICSEYVETHLTGILPVVFDYVFLRFPLVT